MGSAIGWFLIGVLILAVLVVVVTVLVVACAASGMNDMDCSYEPSDDRLEYYDDDDDDHDDDDYDDSGPTVAALITVVVGGKLVVIHAPYSGLTNSPEIEPCPVVILPEGEIEGKTSIAWGVEMTDPIPLEILTVDGVEPILAVDSESTPHLVYLNRDKNRIALMIHHDGYWQLEAVEQNLELNRFANLDMSIGHEGFVHIVLEEWIDDEPWIRYLSNSTGQWTTTAFDDTPAVNPSVSAVSSETVFVAATGLPDADPGVVLHSLRSGAWTTEWPVEESTAGPVYRWYDNVSLDADSTNSPVFTAKTFESEISPADIEALEGTQVKYGLEHWYLGLIKWKRFEFHSFDTDIGEPYSGPVLAAHYDSHIVWNHINSGLHYGRGDEDYIPVHAVIPECGNCTGIDLTLDDQKDVHISYADGENRVAYLTNVKGEFQRLTWTNIPRSTPEACIMATVAKSSF
jgi:hypothetical protein